jgi:hypothetical protein
MQGMHEEFWCRIPPLGTLMKCDDNVEEQWESVNNL